MPTLFERIGGDAAVDAAVDRFYQIVLADGRIKHLFDGVDMERQHRHQKLFFKYAFGGLPNFSGRAMAAAHDDLVRTKGLNDSHFDAVMDDLGQALRDLNVPADLIAEAAAVAETTREAVLGRA